MPLADQLTVARAASVVLVIALFQWNFENHLYWATALFAAAMATDQIDGWLARRLTYTERTLDYVADMGLTYVCDLFHDDQPSPVKTRTGTLVSIPYSLEMNDVIAYNVNLVSPRAYGEIIKRQFDRLYAEAGADA